MPSFAPEIIRRVRLTDAMKAKKLKQALQEMAEEGVVQVFRPLDGSPALIGVVGPLQLDVLRDRLATEYGLPVEFDQSEFQLARWLSPRTARSATTSSRPTAPASPKTSTAISSTSPAASSISTIRASAHREWYFRT